MSFSFEGPKWPSPVITWSFATTNYPSDSADPFTDAITQAAYQQVVESAFQAWGFVSGLTLIPIPDGQGQVADIRVGFGELTGNEVSQTKFSTDPEGNMAPDVVVRLQDPEVRPLMAGANGTLVYQGGPGTFYQIALYAIGRALGLGNSQDPSAVMYPQTTTQNAELSTNDELAITLRYPLDFPGPPPQPVNGTIFLSSYDDIADVNESGFPVALGPNARGAAVVGSYDIIYGGSGSAGNTISIGGSNNTVIGGAGPDTINAITPSNLTFGGTGALTFINTVGSTELVAGPGSTYVQNDAQGGTFFGNAAQLVVWDSVGGAIIAGGSGGVLLHGADIGGNDVVFAAPGSAISLNGTTSNNWLIAGAGNDTIDASQATGNELLCSGSGSDLLAGGAGNDFLFAGTGNATMSGGGGANVFEFAAGQSGGADVITDFSATDRIILIGYGPNEAAQALGTQSNTGGSTIIRVSDNTTITLAGAANLNSSNVLTG